MNRSRYQKKDRSNVIESSIYQTETEVIGRKAIDQTKPIKQKDI